MTAVRKPSLNLYLIRHGQTEWSLSGQHTGRTDIPLTAHGEDEARKLAPWLQPVAFARVLTSPRQRARRTCALAGLEARAEVVPALAEWDYGDYEGKQSAEIKQSRPGWTIFRDGCPNGEMPDDVAARADRLLDDLAGTTGNVALFTHGHFGVALATRWIGLSVIEGARFSLGTGSLSMVGYAPNHPDTRVIALWNAVPAVLRGT